jgi:diguanylate cyclase (GGDEF)-like protein
MRAFAHRLLPAMTLLLGLVPLWNSASGEALAAIQSQPAPGSGERASDRNAMGASSAGTSADLDNRVDAFDEARRALEHDRPAGLQQLQALAENNASPDQLRAQLALGEALLVDGDGSGAHAMAERALAAPAVQLGSLRVVAATLWLKSAPIDALALADDNRLPWLEAQLAQLTAASERGALLQQLGVRHVGVGHFKRAEAVFARALAELGEPIIDLHPKVHEAIGVTRAQQGNYAGAVEAFRAAELADEALGKPPNWNLLGNFGGLYIYLQDWPKAIDYLQRALAAGEAQGGTPLQLVRLYGNLGTAYVGAKQPEQAMQWFDRVLETTDGDHPNHATALNNSATVLRDWGRLDEALQRFIRVRALYASRSDTGLQGVAEKNIGETLVRMGQLQRAQTHLQAAYELYAASDLRPKRLELFPVLIDNLEALGRQGEALERMREFKRLSDEVVNVDSKTRIAGLENSLEVERKQRELIASQNSGALQRAEIELLQAERHRQQLWSWGLLGGLVSALLILVLLVRDRLFKARASALLAQRNLQIETEHQNLLELNAQIRQQSVLDALTGLYNRRFLNEYISATARRFEADPTTAPLQLILADIDWFKQINDQHGHLLGDDVLRWFAGILRDCAEAEDVVVRWGGEEFLLICGGGAERAARRCERIRAALAARTFRSDSILVDITASFGFAQLPLWPGAEVDWQASLRVADFAVYRAKHEGRNRWAGFEWLRAPQAGRENSDGAWIESLEATGQVRCWRPGSLG